ncbi:MAG TPA: cbb3-type cytochrome c oxidase subunit 3 [Deltaproteobacteria bacterium]|nr:cbb3-type cytochrome c oxidase subunit 3 [Deltaproteobacteria bacterium]
MLDQGTLRGVITLLTLVTFLGIVWWAYRPGNRERFEDDARLAFDEEGGAPMNSDVRGRMAEGSASAGGNEK